MLLENGAKVFWGNKMREKNQYVRNFLPDAMVGFGAKEKR
jgi:hypothetical protein